MVVPPHEAISLSTSCQSSSTGAQERGVSGDRPPWTRQYGGREGIQPEQCIEREGYVVGGEWESWGWSIAVGGSETNIVCRNGGSFSRRNLKEGWAVQNRHTLCAPIYGDGEAVYSVCQGKEGRVLMCYCSRDGEVRG